MTDIDGDPDGDVEMTEREQVEGIEYDNRLENQYQATLFQQTDKRTQLEKLRDGYTKNIAKLNKEQLRSLFRDAQKAGMKETFTQCKNMNKQQAAVLQFYIKEFHANGVDIVSHKAGLLFVDITGEKDTKGMGTVRWNAKFENLFQKHRIGWEHIRTWAVRMVDDGLCGRSAPNMSTMLNECYPDV